MSSQEQVIIFALGITPSKCFGFVNGLKRFLVWDQETLFTTLQKLAISIMQRLLSLSVNYLDF